MLDLLEVAKNFATRVQNWPETREILSRNNHIIQFALDEGEFLCLIVSDGRIEIMNQKAENDYWKVLTLETSRRGAIALLSGRTTIARLIQQGDLQVEYAKRPLVSWFGQVVRLHREKLMREAFEPE